MVATQQTTSKQTNKIPKQISQGVVSMVLKANKSPKFVYSIYIRCFEQFRTVS